MGAHSPGDHTAVVDDLDPYASGRWHDAYADRRSPVRHCVADQCREDMFQVSTIHQCARGRPGDAHAGRGGQRRQNGVHGAAYRDRVDRRHVAGKHVHHDDDVTETGREGARTGVDVPGQFSPYVVGQGRPILCEQVGEAGDGRERLGEVMSDRQGEFGGAATGSQPNQARRVAHSAGGAGASRQEPPARHHLWPHSFAFMANGTIN